MKAGKSKNVDVAVLAQAPKLMPYKSKMKFHIAFELALMRAVLMLRQRPMKV